MADEAGLQELQSLHDGLDAAVADAAFNCRKWMRALAYHINSDLLVLQFYKLNFTLAVRMRARGQIARTYKYMAEAYGPRYRMSRQQQQLMDAWDTTYPHNCRSRLGMYASQAH